MTAETSHQKAARFLWCSRGSCGSGFITILSLTLPFTLLARFTAHFILVRKRRTALVLVLVVAPSVCQWTRRRGATRVGRVPRAELQTGSSPLQPPAGRRRAAASASTAEDGDGDGAEGAEGAVTIIAPLLGGGVRHWCELLDSRGLAVVGQRGLPAPRGAAYSLGTPPVAPPPLPPLLGRSGPAAGKSDDYQQDGGPEFPLMLPPSLVRRGGAWQGVARSGAAGRCGAWPGGAWRGVAGLPSWTAAVPRRRGVVL